MFEAFFDLMIFFLVFVFVLILMTDFVSQPLQGVEGMEDGGGKLISLGFYMPPKLN